MHETARVAAYFFTVRLDGWRAFCLDAKIEPDALLDGLPGIETIRRTEGVARMLACTAEEANRWLRGKGGEDDQVITTEEETESIREFVNRSMEWWD
jgi:hypothetical protein